MVFLVFLGLAGDRKSVNVVNDNYIAPMEIKMKSVIKKFANRVHFIIEVHFL